MDIRDLLFYSFTGGLLKRFIIKTLDGFYKLSEKSIM